MIAGPGSQFWVLSSSSGSQSIRCTGYIIMPDSSAQTAILAPSASSRIPSSRQPCAGITYAESGAPWRSSNGWRRVQQVQVVDYPAWVKERRRRFGRRPGAVAYAPPQLPSLRSGFGREFAPGEDTEALAAELGRAYWTCYRNFTV